MNDTKELKAAAEACGPLPWRLIELGLTRLGVRDDHGFIAFMDIGHPAKYGACPDREAKARFIGHATPAAVLALIAELNKVDADRKACWAEFKVQGRQLDQLKTERDQSEQDYKDVVGTIELRDIEIVSLKNQNEALRKDAGRWRAFINCARIKFFGWAGYAEKDPYGNSPGNYRHFGGEFWTIHDAPTADKEKAAEILNGFADAAVAAMGKEAANGA